MPLRPTPLIASEMTAAPEVVHPRCAKYMLRRAASAIFTPRAKPPTECRERKWVIMSYWSRRDMLRLSAGAAAVAVPITALSVVSGGSSASSPAPTKPIKKLTEAEIKRSGTGRVMLCVHDASRGEISILQGTREVIVKDHQLVAQVMRAAGVSRES